MARQFTITLDDDVAERLDEEAARQDKPSAEILSEAVRLALGRIEAFEINGPFASSKPGAGSFDCIGRVLDELEGPEWK